MIVSAWAIQSIRIKKLIFRKTSLDIPLIIYLSIYLVSSLLSINPRTSWLGYYGRFNGGLISQICYVTLYWAFVSHIKTVKESLSVVRFGLAGTVIASILAIGEHNGVFTTCKIIGFSLEKSCWLQDVQTRVFSTLGQPNWLAAILVALLPITWSQILQKSQTYKIFWFLISILFFVTLLFTKSRSGLLAFGVESLIFWGFIFWKEKSKFLKEFIFSFLSFSFLAFMFWFNPQPTTHNLPETVAAGPALESGGTESGTIRKFVWLGALQVFKHYPILGTGPETFAFSFPMYKPVGHNLTSEWDYLYNKAHNEFLNYLANTGIIGFAAYIVLIIISLKMIFNNKRLELLAGYVAILVTNFFGFSVVPISLLFFLYPAISLASSAEDQAISYNSKKIDINQKISIILVLLTSLYTLHTIYSYWQADISYNKAKMLARENKHSDAILELDKSIKFSPTEGIYLSELALDNKSDEVALKALDLNKYNQNIRRIVVNNLVGNSGENPNNLFLAEEIIIDGINYSPNDPKMYYQLGILQLKINKNDSAIRNLQNAIELKTNYKEARFALGSIHKALKDDDKAKVQFEYILKNIDPNDELTKKYLKEVN